MKTYDAIVIGSGQGGVPLATDLADQGWSVALIEKANVGGSCINYGCTPTKTMISSARFAHYARVAPEFGIHPGKAEVNMAEVVARKNEIVELFRSGVQEQIESSPKLTLYRGHGRFTAPHEVGVNGETLKSDKIFINTGTRPRIQALPGLDQVEVLDQSQHHGFARAAGTPHRARWQLSWTRIRPNVSPSQQRSDCGRDVGSRRGA